MHAITAIAPTSGRTVQAATMLFALRKSVIAAVKLRIFDIPLSATDIGSRGYEKPEKAHTAKTMNIPARENSVYFDSFVNGDSVSSENVEISTRNTGRKKSSLNSVGAGGRGGYVLPMTIRSNGSSNIIGAAAVPTKALPSATFSPNSCLLGSARA